FRMPYQEYDEAYKVSRYFVWQSLRPIPAYHHEVMRKFLVDIQPSMDKQFRSPGRAVLWTAIRTFRLWIVYLGPSLTIPQVMLPRVLRDRRTRFLAVAFGV